MSRTLGIACIAITEVPHKVGSRIMRVITKVHGHAIVLIAVGVEIGFKHLARIVSEYCNIFIDRISEIVDGVYDEQCDRVSLRGVRIVCMNRRNLTGYITIPEVPARNMESALRKIIESDIS